MVGKPVAVRFQILDVRFQILDFGFPMQAVQHCQEWSLVQPLLNENQCGATEDALPLRESVSAHLDNLFTTREATCLLFLRRLCRLECESQGTIYSLERLALAAADAGHVISGAAQALQSADGRAGCAALPGIAAKPVHRETYGCNYY